MDLLRSSGTHRSSNRINKYGKKKKKKIVFPIFRYSDSGKTRRSGTRRGARADPRISAPSPATDLHGSSEGRHRRLRSPIVNHDGHYAYTSVFYCTHEHTDITTTPVERESSKKSVFFFLSLSFSVSCTPKTHTVPDVYACERKRNPNKFEIIKISRARYRRTVRTRIRYYYCNKNIERVLYETVKKKRNKKRTISVAIVSTTLDTAEIKRRFVTFSIFIRFRSFFL